jgi:hypothetical protein
LFAQVAARLDAADRHRLARLLWLDPTSRRSEFDRLLGVFGDVLAGARENSDPATAERVLLATLAKAGGIEQLSAAHEAVSAQHGNNYLPLLERIYKSHRSALFTLLDTLTLEPDQRRSFGGRRGGIPARGPGRTGE